MITDEMLREAAYKAALKMNENLPDLNECDHHFSARFEHKMKKLIHRANHPMQHYILRSAASIVLVLLIGFGSILTVSAEAREIVFGWFKQQYKSFYEYFFEGEPITSDSYQYCPDWMPDGFILVTSFEIEGGETYIYSDDNGKTAQFSYSSNPATLEMYIESVDYEHRQVSIKGLPGDIYGAPNSMESSELIWTDNSSGNIFHVSAPVSEDEIIKIAENIIKK